MLIHVRSVNHNAIMIHASCTNKHTFKNIAYVETSMSSRIKSAPGIGKTVFAEEVILFDNKKNLLLFYMCDQYIQTFASLSDLLEVYANKDKEMISQFKNHINQNGREDVVFLLDGFDECPVKISFLHHLILPNRI